MIDDSLIPSCMYMHETFMKAVKKEPPRSFATWRQNESHPPFLTLDAVVFKHSARQKINSEYLLVVPLYHIRFRVGLGEKNNRYVLAIDTTSIRKLFDSFTQMH